MLKANHLSGFGAFTASSGGEGNDANTVLLLHCDGADGSTTFTDASVGGAHGDATVTGDAHVETDQSVFGGASFYGTQSGAGHINYPSDADWNLGGSGGGNDFTIDFWMRIVSENSTASSVGIMSTNTGGSGWSVIVNLGSTIGLRVGTSTSNLSWSSSANTWYHVAIIREGTTVTCAIDGTSIGTYPDSDMSNDGQALYFNSFAVPSFPSDLYLDEIRISKGIARWTSFPFTPPTEAYG